jgi:hypothetical protein
MNKIQTWNNHQRRFFKPGSNDDLKVVKKYLHSLSWGKEGCPFYLEWPYLDIPSMVKDKITEYALKGLK